MDREPGSFAMLLRHFRTVAGFSQDALAERAGLSPRGISDLERGVRRVPHLTTVGLLADGLGLDPESRQALLAAARPATTAEHETGPLPGGAQLPTPLTGLIGRDRELAELSSLLGTASTRLVTLTGPGGIGKTRLALQVVADLPPVFADGARFVDLSALADPSLVLATIGGILGVRQERVGLADRVAGAIAAKRLLLVLDNFERVIDAAPVVSDLLAACPSLTVLATSRESLRLSGERIFPVPPLALPDRVVSASVAWLMTSEAAQLFVDRAQAVKPDFAVTPENAAAIAEVCSWLDGLPLAIELAAARVTVLSPAALLMRLERRLPLLTGGPRDQPPRLRTMRDAIAWSYDLLPENEQRLFRRLAVFAGGFTLEGAEAVADTDRSATEVFDGIASLIDKCLVRQEAGGEGEPRFRVLDTIREFGLEQLTHCGDEAAARRAHARYCRALAGRSFAGVHSADHARWMERSETEHNNFRGALAWLLDTDDTEAAQDLCGALYRFWYVRGHLSEGLAWAERALAAGPMTPPGVRSWALLAAAWLAWATGDYGLASCRAHAAHDLFAAGAAAAGMAEALYVLGVVAEDQGDYAAAEAQLIGSLQRFRDLDEPTWIGFTLNALGLVAYEQEDRARARSLFEEALAHFRAVGELHGTGFALTNLGKIALAAGDAARAAACYQEALRLRHDYGEQVAVAGCLRGLATIAAGAGQFADAARLFGAAERLREAVGLPPPRHRGRHDSAVAETRARLGEDQWREAILSGREMPLPEAVAAALAIAPKPGGRETLPSSHGLTSRELDVLRLLAAGYTDQRIAEALFVSRRTANTHVQHIFGKLGVNSRAAAAAAAVRCGLVPTPPGPA